MADDADLAQDQIEKSLAQHIRQARTTGVHYAPTGFCHFCDEDVTGKKIFCDHVCASNHDHRERLKSRQGRPD